MPVLPEPESIVNFEIKTIEKKRRNLCANVSWRPILSEFLATTLLILLGCMTTIPLDDVVFQPPMYTPLGFGFIVMLNIQIFGHISGAHMNPSVTLAAIIYGTMSIPMGILYVLAQCAGAIAGYGILINLSPEDMAVGGLCVTQVHQGLNKWQGFIIEILLTTTLNFINCSVWDPVNKAKQDSVPIKFGLAIAGLSFAGGPLTGASMNPARSLGPAVFSGIWRYHWIYWAGPIIGGILPALIYKFTWLKKEEHKNEVVLSQPVNTSRNK